MALYEHDHGVSGNVSTYETDWKVQRLNDVRFLPEEGDDIEVLKVSAHSRPSAVAGAIAGVIRNNGRADLQAIGAGATNQAIKAVAIARDYLEPNGIEIVVVPAFIDVMVADEERTAMRLLVETRSRRPEPEELP